MRLRRCLPLLALLAGVTLAAADFDALKPTGYVNDFAGVLSPAAKQSLEAYCGRVEQATGAQFALVTIRSLDGEPIEDVANLLYRKWGVGSKKSNEGLLVLLAIQDRRSRIEVGYGLEPIIPDGYAGSLLRSVRPALREGDYDQAMLEAAQTLAERIAQAKGVQINGAPARRKPRPRPDGFPWPPVLVGGLVLLFFLFAGGGPGRFSGPRGGGRGGFLPGMLLGQILGGGGPRLRGGGGFGGYDSGDSFGGFGGGDSGGGGASSDW